MENTFIFDKKWQMGSTYLGGKTIEAELPGDNYHALLQAGIIPDPYYGKNELLMQEIWKHDWEFTQTFDVSKELLANNYIYLTMSMIDTFCTCTLNGVEVFKSHNQFAAQKVEVKKLLKKSGNLIKFYIQNPMIEISERKKIAPDYGMLRHTILQGTNLIRKTMCHGGWDWGVQLPVCGIYDEIKLVGVEKSRIDSLYNKQKHENGKVELTAVADIFAPENCEDSFTFEFDGEVKKINCKLSKGMNKIVCVFNVDKPKLWYPNGYGEQNLYDLTIKNSTMEVTKLTGLRTMELVTKEDEIGSAFYFKVNGVRVFGKGADFVPCDAMPSCQTEEVYNDLLNSAVKANMNMLRVWGGGQYEKDLFYDLCDKKGILIWQDLMFCCAMYPADKWLMDEVAEEIDYQIPRLRSHACIAIYCGDNECLGATRWFGPENNEKNLQRFIAVNKHLTEFMGKHDIEQVFWPSSPCGGPGNFGDNWKDDTRGDMHFWEVWNGGKNFDAYYTIKPRFCSEFGFEAFPSMEQIKSFCPPEELNLFSSTMSLRQKCFKHNAPILGMFEMLFKLPLTIEGLVYQSQVQQAIAIKAGVEYWHAHQPRCMGAIYWQLNDNWPTVSWASIEHGGKWKQLNYHAKRFFAPVSGVMFKDTDGDIKHFVINDLPYPVKVKATVNCRSIINGEILSSDVSTLELSPASSQLVRNYGAEFDNNFKPEEVYYEILTENETDNTTHKNEFFATIYKELKLQKAQVSAEISEQDGRFFVELATTAPALYVTLDAVGIKGTFSDNSILLAPQDKVVLEFVPKGSCDIDLLRNSLVIDHLEKYY